MSLLSGARVERREQQFIRGILNTVNPPHRKPQGMPSLLRLTTLIYNRWQSLCKCREPAG